MLYRAWSSLRTTDLLKWQETWIHRNARGFRQNSGTEDVFWELAVRVETAIVKQQELYGVAFDFVKCFDCIPHGILFGVLTEMQVSSRILVPMKAMYASLTRRWKLSQTVVGTEWRTSNGILQGCGVSVILLNCLVCVWLHAVSSEVEVPHTIHPGGYADDIHAVAPSVPALQRVVDITQEYAE